MTKSVYADRNTVGSIAQEALNHHDRPCVGDLGHELLPSFVDDLNEGIARNPFDDRPFYITIHEKKDAQLKNVLCRRVLVDERRPYPEPNTSVFWTDPKTQETRFCWSLPHWSLFAEYLANPDYYNEEQRSDIMAYMKEDLVYFGFRKVGESEEDNKVPKLEAIPNFQDRKLKNT